MNTKFTQDRHWSSFSKLQNQKDRISSLSLHFDSGPLCLPPLFPPLSPELSSRITSGSESSSSFSSVIPRLFHLHRPAATDQPRSRLQILHEYFFLTSQLNYPYRSDPNLYKLMFCMFWRTHSCLDFTLPDLPVVCGREQPASLSFSLGLHTCHTA